MMMEEPDFFFIHKDKIWFLPSEGRHYWHRLDGPAVESELGTIEWWANNKLHRLDGPAIIRRDKTKFWYVAGERHRLDGPSTEGSDGSREWYIYGKELDTEKVEAWLEENEVDLQTIEGQMAFKLAWT